jgi:hypothetical protein
MEVRRPREGARLGLFKNKVGQYKIKKAGRRSERPASTRTRTSSLGARSSASQATARRTGGAETKTSDSIGLERRNKRHGAMYCIVCHSTRSADVLLCFAIFPQHRFRFVRNIHQTKPHSELPRLLALVGALPALFSSVSFVPVKGSNPNSLGLRFIARHAVVDERHVQQPWPLASSPGRLPAGGNCAACWC